MEQSSSGLVVVFVAKSHRRGGFDARWLVVGAVIGGILGAMGASVRVIQMVVASLGFVIGTAISVVPLKMILGKDFGEFRLVLLAKHLPIEPRSSTAGD